LIATILELLMAPAREEKHLLERVGGHWMRFRVQDIRIGEGNDRVRTENVGKMAGLWWRQS
jgi:hypothetical protein